MDIQLLSSENLVKQLTAISDNIAGKYLLPTIQEVQEIYLVEFIGEKLLNKLKEVAGTPSPTPDMEKYINLINYCQYYIAYKSVAELLDKVSYKIGNFGVGKSSDENLQLASYGESTKVKGYYDNKAEFYCHRLQNFLLEHKTDYPELDTVQCYIVKSHLYSSASCGIWLGGRRIEKRRILR